jgi:hypothetical protein
VHLCTVWQIGLVETGIMENPEILKAAALETPVLSERAWQTWLHKNRESDRLAAVRRVKVLQILLACAVMAALIQRFA